MKEEKDYLMPAEWNRHSATQMHWPSTQTDWPIKQLARVEELYCKIIEELSFYEPIHLFVESLEIRNRVMQKLSLRAVELDRLTIHQQRENDVWARDCGPIFVKEGNNYVITDWSFNAFGGKYSHWKEGQALPKYISENFGIKRIETGMRLESGSVDGNGAGALLIIESVLLNSNRNPDLTKEDIEEKLRRYLGAEQIIWLKRGLSENDTYGFMDNITRWLNEDTVLTMVSEDEEDINYAALQENLEILQSVTLKGVKPLTIETLPLAQIKEADAVDVTENVPASYANFYIANGVVLVPLFHKRYDEQALQLFKKYFPGRKIIGIPDTDLGPTSNHGICQPWYGALSF